jgi:glutamyl-tRNA reductase
MAELAARHLITHVRRPVAVVNSTFENACDLARELRGSALRMERLEEGLIDADVVITSTGSCEPLIRTDHIKRVMRKRRYRPLFLIDIAIPRDVESAVNDLDSVYLYNIDDLQAVVEENIGERRQEALRGERIIEEEVAKFMRWKNSLGSTPTIIALKEKLESIRESELQRLNGRLSRLAPEERETVELITKSIINKIAHDPIVYLKKVGTKSRSNMYLDAAQQMFKLDRLSVDQENSEEESIEEETDNRNQG